MSRPSLILVAITILQVQSAVAVPAQVYNRVAHLNSRSPQVGAALTGVGGALGDVLGGLGGLLGGVVGGLGTGLGNTVSGLGSAVGGLVGYKPKPVSPSQPPIPAVPAIVASLKVSARADRPEIACRKYPDLISHNWKEILPIAPKSQIEVVCWTAPSIKEAVGGDHDWLKTKVGCFIDEDDIINGNNSKVSLKPCPQPLQHSVGTLDVQYKRQDCYNCQGAPGLSLDCPSHNVANPAFESFVDLECTKQGQEVNGNSTWVKSRNEDCFFPGTIFNIYGWLGTQPKDCSGYLF